MTIVAHIVLYLIPGSYVHTYSYVLMIEIPIYSSEARILLQWPRDKKKSSARCRPVPSMTLRSQGTRETVWVPNARRGLSAHEDMISTMIDEMIYLEIW
jgi:hypothetical protein